MVCGGPAGRSASRTKRYHNSRRSKRSGPVLLGIFTISDLRSRIVAIYAVASEAKTHTAWRQRRAASRFVFLSIALLSYTLAIYHSQASYVSILTMLTPITLILISARYFSEKINRRKVAGIALAMIGALVVVSLPLMATGNVTTAAYPLATALTLLNCVTFALTYIYMRKANEAGMPMMGVLGIISFIRAAVTAPLFLLFGDTARMPNDPSFFMAVFYSAIGVSVVFRAILVSAYERIGAVSTAAVQYIETLASVVIPVLIISEKLSLEMIAGGLMILAGVYFIESKEAKVGKRWSLHRHH